MVREVITYPHKLLRTKSEDVVEFNEELHTLLDDMYETMIAQNGVGLAAIQVSISLNVLIISISDENDIEETDNYFFYDIEIWYKWWSVIFGIH